MFKVGNVCSAAVPRHLVRQAGGRRSAKGVLASPNICYGCDYYRFCIKAGDINYDEQVNFRNDVMLREEEELPAGVPSSSSPFGSHNLVGLVRALTTPFLRRWAPSTSGRRATWAELPDVFVSPAVVESAEESIWAREGRNAHVAGGVVPQLRLEGYKGFNVIQYDWRFFGLAQEEGAFDVAKADAQGYRRCVEASSVEGTKREVDRRTEPRNRGADRSP